MTEYKVLRRKIASGGHSAVGVDLSSKLGVGLILGLDFYNSMITILIMISK